MMQAVLAVVVLALLYLCLVSPNPRKRKFEAPGLFAHRGLHGHGAPENSLAAFCAAAEHGYGIELDVQLTGDDHLIVFHDDTLPRICGREGNVQQMTLKELRACRLLDTELGIPTLDEVLDLIDGRVPLLIELKNCARVRELAELCMSRLRAYKGAYLIESFSPLALWALRRGHPTAIRGQLVSKLDIRHRYAPLAVMFALSHLLLNILSRPDFIAYDRRMLGGFALFVQRNLFRVPLAVWTVKCEADYQRLKGQAQMVIFEGFMPDRSAGPARSTAR